MEKERPAPRWVPTGEIPMNRFEKSESDDLEDYLDDDFNYDIYRQIRGDTEVEPLEYFHRFYRVLSFVIANLKRPLEVERHLEETDPVGWYYHYMLPHLLSYSEMLDKVEGKPALRNSLAMKHIALVKHHYDLDVEAEKESRKRKRSPKAINTEWFNAQLDSMSHFREQRAFLVRRRTENRHRLRHSTEYDEHVYKDVLAWIEDKLDELDVLEKLEGQKVFDEPNPDNATPESKDQFDLTKEEKLLASICPLFRDATPDTQRKVWSKLSGFTRNQWAMFLIEANPKKKDYASKDDAANAIIKPKAKIIEAITRLTNMRGVVFVENSKQYAKDERKVKGITKLLYADSIMRRSE